MSGRQALASVMLSLVACNAAPRGAETARVEKEVWLEVGGEQVLLTVERAEVLRVMVSVFPETPTAFDPVDDVVRAVPAGDVDVTVEHGGMTLTPLSAPVGYLSVISLGRALQAYGDYVFEASELPPSPVEVDLTITYEGSSSRTTVSL